MHLDLFTENILLMQATEDAFERAKAIIGEHFPNYAIVVQYDDGSIWHESNNDLVERPLYLEALQMIKEEKQGEALEPDVYDDDEEDAYEKPFWEEDEEE